eukprot:2945877-Rhodomonas_salina.2
MHKADAAAPGVQVSVGVAPSSCDEDGAGHACSAPCLACPALRPPLPLPALALGTRWGQADHSGPEHAHVGCEDGTHHAACSAIGATESARRLRAPHGMPLRRYLVRLQLPGCRLQCPGV